MQEDISRTLHLQDDDFQEKCRLISVRKRGRAAERYSDDHESQRDQWSRAKKKVVFIEPAHSELSVEEEAEVDDRIEAFTDDSVSHFYGLDEGDDIV
jgi:hypothetical protein